MPHLFYTNVLGNVHRELHVHNHLFLNSAYVWQYGDVDPGKNDRLSIYVE